MTIWDISIRINPESKLNTCYELWVQFQPNLRTLRNSKVYQKWINRKIQTPRTRAMPIQGTQFRMGAESLSQVSRRRVGAYEIPRANGTTKNTNGWKCHAAVMFPCASETQARVIPQPGHDISVMTRNKHGISVILSGDIPDHAEYMPTRATPIRKTRARCM